MEQSSLEELIYSPLMEEESTTGWTKDTLDYVFNHEGKIKRQIRNIARGFRKSSLQTADVEDMYSDIVLYLYKNDDYDIDKAMDRSRSNCGDIVSIEGYVSSCVKCCVMRACKQLGQHDRSIVPESVTSDDDHELSIFDSIADDKASINIDHLEYDIESLCKSFEPIRYRFGPDIYLVWYIRILTEKDRSGELFHGILEALGISKRELSRFSKYREDSPMLSMAKAINLFGPKRVLKELRKYVYSASTIENAVYSIIK